MDGHVILVRLEESNDERFIQVLNVYKYNNFLKILFVDISFKCNRAHCYEGTYNNIQKSADNILNGNINSNENNNYHKFIIINLILFKALTDNIS